MVSSLEDSALKQSTTDAENISEIHSETINSALSWARPGTPPQSSVSLEIEHHLHDKETERRPSAASEEDVNNNQQTTDSKDKTSSTSNKINNTGECKKFPAAVVPPGTSVPNGTNDQQGEKGAREINMSQSSEYVADGGSNIQKTISFSEEEVVMHHHHDVRVSTTNYNILETEQTRIIATTMNDQKSTTDSSHNQKEPEGLRVARTSNVSRRFDEDLLKEVMEEKGEKERELSSSSSSTIPPVIDEHEQLFFLDEGHCDSVHELSKSLSPSKSHQQDCTKKEDASDARISREPPCTPARLHKDTMKVLEDADHKINVPVFPTDGHNIDEEEDGQDSSPEGTQVSESSTTRFTDTPQESSDVASPDEGSTVQTNIGEHTEQLQSPDRVTTRIASRPQSFTTQLSQYAGPVHAPVAAAPPSSHIEFESIARSSFAQATSNKSLHASGVIYPSVDMAIPHLPQLASAPASIHANGYHHAIPAAALPPAPSQAMTPGGKRRIHLRLEEDVSKPEKSSFLSFRRRGRPPSHSPINEIEPSLSQNRWVDRGNLSISWYEGTSSLELQEHVRNSVIRKLRLQGTTKLADIRVLDDSVSPPEEIVLCPYIPNGSRLLLRFTTKDAGGDATPQYPRLSDYSNGPPESPSAAPSPYPTALDLGGLGLNANQLALLGARLKGLQIPSPDQTEGTSHMKIIDGKKPLPKFPNFKPDGNTKTGNDSTEKNSKDDDEDDNSKGSNTEVASLHPEDQIQRSLREITELLIAERSGKLYAAPRQEKRQVIFVLANYFVLFLSLIAISAEIQARAPEWHAAMEGHLKNVQNCSKDKESLFECVENGDFAGLIASVVLWISRSAATKRIFLFGFESPKRLWTVVYESLVTAVCWGFSYIFIRRGMNPDTNRNFLQKYWKDAVYGSLAGFNAAFMKHVLKNLIPQEAIEDALQERQLKILSWLPSFS